MATNPYGWTSPAGLQRQVGPKPTGSGGIVGGAGAPQSQRISGSPNPSATAEAALGDMRSRQAGANQGFLSAQNADGRNLSASRMASANSQGAMGVGGRPVNYSTQATPYSSDMGMQRPQANRPPTGPSGSADVMFGGGPQGGAPGGYQPFDMAGWEGPTDFRYQARPSGGFPMPPVSTSYPQPIDTKQFAAPTMNEWYANAFDPANFATDDLRRQWSSYLENTGQLAQMQGELYQQGVGNQQWGLEYNRALGEDAFNRYNTDRTQTREERAASDASRQAWAGLGLEGYRTSEELRQSGLEGDRSYALGGRAADTAQFNATTGRMQTANELAIQTERNRIEEAFNRGQLSTAQYNAETGRLDAEAQAERSRAQTTLEGRQIDINRFQADTDQFNAETTRLIGTGQLDIGQFEAETERLGQEALAAFQSGQISNEAFNNQTLRQRQLADAAHQKGLIDNEKYNAITSRLDQQSRAALGGRAAATDEMRARTERELGGREASTNEMRARNEFTLGSREAGTNEFRSRTERYSAEQDAQIRAEANDIDRRYKEGTLSLGQAQQALAELENRQQFGINQREMSLAEQTQSQLENFRRWQQTQNEALERERIASQNLQTRYQVFGRGMAPASFRRAVAS